MPQHTDEALCFNAVVGGICIRYFGALSSNCDPTAGSTTVQKRKPAVTGPVSKYDDHSSGMEPTVVGRKALLSGRGTERLRTSRTLPLRQIEFVQRYRSMNAVMLSVADAADVLPR